MLPVFAVALGYAVPWGITCAGALDLAEIAEVVVIAFFVGCIVGSYDQETKTHADGD